MLDETSMATRFVGDWLFTFGEAQPVAGRTSAGAWTRAEKLGEATVWEQASAPGWKGFPVRELPAPDWRVWLIGELYGYTDDAEAAGRVRDVVQGKRSAEGLNGHFLLLAWEETRERWHAWTDRFGTIHAYHAQGSAGVALGTCFRAVAQVASRRELDWAGLAGFFGFGFFPEDRTFYGDVRILQPARHYIFGPHGALEEASRYWNWKHEPNCHRSYEATVAEFGELFGQLMGGLLSSGRVALPISGGLDSRSTVAGVGHEGVAGDGRREMGDGGIWSYSYGYSGDSIETRIAREVAATRRLPFKAFTIGPYLFDRLERVMGAVEGFQDVTQCRQAAVMEELGTRADYVIAAHWGDVWLDEMGLCSRMRDETGNLKHGKRDGKVLEHTLKKMAKRGRGWLFAELCTPKLAGAAPEHLLRDFAGEGLAKLAGIEDPDFRIKAFKTDHWSFRWTLASLRMFQPGAFPRLPFYDTRLADFFSTVPTEYVAGRRLQIDYLKRFAPELARIDWQPHRANLYRYDHFDPLRLARRVVSKAGRVLTGSKVIERNWEVQFGGDQGQAGLSHWLLRPGLRLHDLVPKPRIEALLASFRDDPLTDGRGYTVSMLLTFSAWLELHGG